MRAGLFIHLFVAMLAYSTAWADQPPEYYLELRYSLVSEKTERTGVIYNYWVDPRQSAQYLNVVDKLLPDLRRSSEMGLTTARVFDEILLYKFPSPLAFDGKASFSNVNARDVSLEDISSIVVTNIYAVDYDGALHSALTKEDLEGWAKEDNATQVADVEGNQCFFHLYRHGDGDSGGDVIKKIKSLVPGIDFGSSWTTDPRNGEYLRLVNQLREHHIVMIEYCGC